MRYVSIGVCVRVSDRAPLKSVVVRDCGLPNAASYASVVLHVVSGVLEGAPLTRSTGEMAIESSVGGMSRNQGAGSSWSWICAADVIVDARFVFSGRDQPTYAHMASQGPCIRTGRSQTRPWFLAGAAKTHTLTVCSGPPHAASGLSGLPLFALRGSGWEERCSQITHQDATDKFSPCVRRPCVHRSRSGYRTG